MALWKFDGYMCSEQGKNNLTDENEVYNEISRNNLVLQKGKTHINCLNNTAHVC